MLIRWTTKHAKVRSFLDKIAQTTHYTDMFMTVSKLNCRVKIAKEIDSMIDNTDVQKRLDERAIAEKRIRHTSSVYYGGYVF